MRESEPSNVERHVLTGFCFCFSCCSRFAYAYSRSVCLSASVGITDSAGEGAAVRHAPSQ